MKMNLRRLIFSACATLVLSASAQAALVLSLEQAVPGSVLGGAVVPIDVVLRGERTATIALAQFRLTVPTGGASFSTALVSDGFDESPLAGRLSRSLDGSLVNSPTLSFAIDSTLNDPGIVPGTNDVRLGTLYLQTPTGAGSYPLGFSQIEFADDNFDPVAVGAAGLTVTAVVPEPAGLVIGAVLGLAFVRRPARGWALRRNAAFA